MKFTAFDNRFIIFPIIFLFIYIFAAAVPLGSDLYFMPVWARNLAPNTKQTELEGIIEENTESLQSTAEQFNGKTPKVFITESRFGYFTAEGELLRSIPITERISASSFAWTKYGKTAAETPLYYPDGTLITTINEAGFAYIDDNRFYLFEPGGSAVKQYGADGQPLWRYLHTAPITAFHSAKSGTVIGFSDGKLVCLDAAGSVLFDFYPGGSNYQVILGAGLSEDGRFAACICGLERQRVLLIRIDGNKYKIVHHRYLNGDLRRQVFVDFDSESTTAVFECTEGFGFIDCIRQEVGIIPQQGTLIASGSSPYKNIMAVISKNEQISTLSFVESPSYVIGKTTFPSKNTFLVQERNTLFLATDTKLMRIDIKGILK